MTEVLCHSFQLLESRAQRAMRENNVANDLADLVLEEEELPFLTNPSSSYFLTWAFFVFSEINFSYIWS